MPIKPLILQRRHAELGRIRLGYQAAVGDSGRTRPAKLETFRFTSVSERYIADLATLYGGEPKAWDNSGIKSWEVYTEAKSVPVIAVKGGLSQWMEFWQGGGCTHRCDGETNVLTGEPCDLNEKVTMRVRGRDVQVNPHTEAKPTTRLSLMLPELEAIGVWRCETKGWNAAAEIPAVAELAQYVGDLVPAHLHLQERRSIKDGKTSRFVVPVLDLQIGTARLREIVAEKSGTTAPAIEAAASTTAPAIEAPKQPAAQPAAEQPAAAQVSIPTPQQIAAADLDTARQMHAYLEQHLGEHPATAAARNRVAALTATQPDADGIVDADVVEDQAVPTPGAEASAEQIWQQILATAGRAGMRTADLEDHFASQMGGLTSAEASASELQAYLDLVTELEAAGSAA